ncbi:Probable beta-1,4-xylosyltransferase IRX14H [Linum perenne]
MMKFSAIHQSYLSRRPGSFRNSPSDSPPEGGAKSPSAAFWVVLHGLCCLISLVLGYRFSRLVFFFLFSASAITSTNNQHFVTPFRQLINPAADGVPAVETVNVPAAVNRTKVMVGRHGIRIRPWPHPNPIEVMKAHQMIERVQREQRMQFGVKNPKTIIAVTPTYVRTFQTLHLTGVVHSLMLVPYDVVWIVVEAGGVTNETAHMVSKSGLKNTIHVGVEEKMPNTWEGRHRLESQMRIQALRVVREKKLDGIVMFADDSNMHSMEFFDEIQNVNWFGAVSLGILTHSSNVDEKNEKGIPVQGPACNASDKLAGWHTFDSQPYEGNSAVYIDDVATVLPRKHEWAGFVLNSKLLWEDVEDKPDWVRDLDSVVEDAESPLSLVKDSSMVEPLGSCGRQVLLWWVRVEARFDSKFPAGWMINPRLDITVPSKQTPWPDVATELPSTTNMEEPHPIKHVKTRSSSRSKRRSKKKHEQKASELPQINKAV